MYVVIKVGAHQYKVTEGEEILVDKTENPEAQVLMLVNGEAVSVGKPVLDNIAVKLSVMEDVRGEKIDVFKYKSKSRSRKHTGFRHDFTRVKVEKITSTKS